MKLSLGFSPCPNDTFIFDAMVHHKIDTEGLEFEVFMEDVETLNRRAFNKELDVTKLSYHALAWLVDSYALLDAGSALGNNCGPLLIANKELSRDEVNQGKIAIPGKYTTANFLFSLAYPDAKNKKEFVFSGIESALLNNEMDAGVIIHENRFTYQDKGLIKIIDLGEFWEKTTGLPIPLGGIAVKRSLPLEVQFSISRVMARSVAYAFANPSASESYVAAHAQEMDPHVRQQHIQLYVNEFSQDLGEKGRSAVTFLFQKAKAEKIIPPYTCAIFLNYENL